MLKQKIYVKRQKQTFGGPGITSLCRRAVKATLQAENIEDPVEIDILISDDKGIAEINMQYRNKPEPTDVLSFPTGDYIPGNFQGKVEDFNHETGCIHLGDIILSNERAVKQAVTYGHETSREIAYLIVHATLHLLGYDHMNEADKEIMRQREEVILQQIGLLR